MGRNVGFQALAELIATLSLCGSICKYNFLLVNESSTGHPQVIHTSHTNVYLLSAKSVLLPTSMIMTSLPLSVLTSSIHFEVCWNEFRSAEEKCAKQLQHKRRHSAPNLFFSYCQKQVLTISHKMEVL